MDDILQLTPMVSNFLGMLTKYQTHDHACESVGNWSISLDHVFETLYSKKHLESTAYVSYFKI